MRADKPGDRFFIELSQKQVSGTGRARSRNGTMAEEMARSKARWLDLRLPGAKQRVKPEMGVE